MSSTHRPPPGAKTIDQILTSSRQKLTRLTPQNLHSELHSANPIHIIDIRPAAQRNQEGPFVIPSTQVPKLHRVHVIERNVLEWRLDPQCEARRKDVVDAAGYGTRIVVVCSEGYTSSLAAAALQEIGLRAATDLDGGWKAWVEFRGLEEITLYEG